MASPVNGDLRRRKSPAPTPAEFQGSPGSTLSAYVALFMWMGFVHFTIVAILASFIFLPFSKALGVVGLFLIAEVIPIDEQSKLGRKVAKFIFKSAIGYFPVNLYVEDIKAFDPNEAYVFGYEPHSVWPIGIIALADLTGFMNLPRIKVLASNAVFKVPFMRHIWAWSGAAPATRENFTSLLESGYSCIIVPGGILEVIFMERGSEVAIDETRPTKNELCHSYSCQRNLCGRFILCGPCFEIAYLKKRKGFVRIAIETGKPLVPVFCFGQSEAFHWWKPKAKLYQQLSRAIKVAPVFFWGVLGTPVALRCPMHVVVGQPILLKKNPKPTTEEVDAVHSQFVEAIQDLFERHKERVGYRSHLTIL